jgi:hypothetical protein
MTLEPFSMLERTGDGEAHMRCKQEFWEPAMWFREDGDETGNPRIL